MGQSPPATILKRQKVYREGKNLQTAQPTNSPTRGWAEAGKEEDRDCRDSPEGGKRREGRGLQGLKPQQDRIMITLLDSNKMTCNSIFDRRFPGYNTWWLVFKDVVIPLSP